MWVSFSYRKYLKRDLFNHFRIVTVATGLSTPNIPPIVGIDLATGYENLSLNIEEFENQSVLILG